MGNFLSTLLHPEHSFTATPTSHNPPSLHVAGVQRVLVNSDGTTTDIWELRSQLHTLSFRPGRRVTIYRDVDQPNGFTQAVAQGKIMRTTSYDDATVSYLLFDSMSERPVHLIVPRTTTSINIWDKLRCWTNLVPWTDNLSPHPPRPINTKRTTPSLPPPGLVNSLDLECGRVRLFFINPPHKDKNRRLPLPSHPL
jgi:hypothetical protein